jgi:hypothetical protein
VIGLFGPITRKRYTKVITCKLKFIFKITLIGKLERRSRQHAAPTEVVGRGVKIINMAPLTELQPDRRSLDTECEEIFVTWMQF